MKPSEALRKRVRKIGTGPLSDAMHKTGAMQHQIQCRSANPRMAGPAFSVRVHTADLLMVIEAVATCPPGHVLIIDGRGESNTALCGGLLAEAAHKRGIEGIVVDGAIRDLAVISRLRLPVFARSVVPNAGGAEYEGQIGVTVSCGGQPVSPGDWIVGDEDGIVVVPATQFDAVIELGERIVKAEIQIARQIRAGQSVADIFKTRDLLDRKRQAAFLPQFRATTE